MESSDPATDRSAEQGHSGGHHMASEDTEAPLLLGADHCHSTYITVVKSTTPVYSVHATHMCTKVYIRIPYSEVVRRLLHSPRGIAS